MSNPTINFPGQNQTKASLTINLDAVEENYTRITKILSNVETAAVVKANAYGLGAKKIGMALFKAGCRIFFVAHLDEGIELRKSLPSCQICILNGLDKKTEGIYKNFHLQPVLGSLNEINLWRRFCSDDPLPCCLHIDTGMLRLGVPTNELALLMEDQSIIQGLNVTLVMSHLASADDKTSPQNKRQLTLFKKVRQVLNMGRASLAASSGIFLGKEFHFDLVRPGIAIYGGNPTPYKSNPMLPVISLKAQIKQIRIADRNQVVGYGGTYKVKSPSKIATLAIGYADGLLRALSNKGICNINGFDAPIIGRISMDLITIDVSNVPGKIAFEGQWVEIIGPNRTIDQIAKEASTIGHEILTSLGMRYNRTYISEKSAARES